MNFFPESTSGTMRALSSGKPKFNTGGRPMIAPAWRPAVELRLRTRSEECGEKDYHLRNLEHRTARALDEL